MLPKQAATSHKDYAKSLAKQFVVTGYRAANETKPFVVITPIDAGQYLNTFNMPAKCKPYFFKD